MLAQRRTDSHRHKIRRTDAWEIRAAQLRKIPLNTLLPEHALVINLKRSEERLQNFNQENVFNGTTEVIEAIEGMNIEPHPPMWSGDIACLRSHRKAIEYAKEKGWEMVMIFEDDIRFVADFNEKLKVAMRELPENFHMLWLAGADRNISVPYSKNLKVNTGMWGAYSIILRNTVYDYFIKLFENETKSSDDWFSLNHTKFNSFKTAQALCIHIGKVSDRTLVNHNRR